MKDTITKREDHFFDYRFNKQNFLQNNSIVLTSVGDPDPDPHVFGLPDPDPLVKARYGSGIIKIITQNFSKKKKKIKLWAS
jgi:hypothetical protein